MPLCIFILLFFLIPAWAHAGECTVSERGCLLTILENEAAKIENVSWRDQTYRELAKSLAGMGKTAEAMAIIAKIETPDTQAMTIRGIGMEAADLKLDEAAADSLFEALRVEAEKIDHPPSYAIALTYIAMSQAFAGDNDGAWKTASEMENPALRHKAYGETGEIQAEKGDYAAAMKSIGFIESEAYKNKSYALVSKILAGRGQLQEALNAAMPITNPYKKAQALQTILNAQASAKALKSEDAP